MLDVQAVMFLLELVSTRFAAARLDPDRGDVAEKIVIVGIFVALALVAGFIIHRAVVTDANNIGRTITNAP